MARICGIVGPTGSGKSRSTKNLNPDETFILCVADADLPFKGALSKYSIDKKNYFKANGYKDVMNVIDAVDNRLLNIKSLVIDDMIYLLSNEFFDRATDVGFEKFTQMAANFKVVLNRLYNMRNTVTVFCMLHPDNLESNGKIIGKKLRLMGKLIEEKYNPLELMTVCLWCVPGIKTEHTEAHKETVKLCNDTVKRVGEGKHVKEIRKDVSGSMIAKGDAVTYGVDYRFLTNRAWVEGIEYPAKSPDEMFDTLFIPNDLQFVLDKLYEFYY